MKYLISSHQRTTGYLPSTRHYYLDTLSYEIYLFVFYNTVVLEFIIRDNKPYQIPLLDMPVIPKKLKMREDMRIKEVIDCVDLYRLSKIISEI